MSSPYTPIFGNFGIRRLADQFQRVMRAGLPAWLRIKNFEDNSAYADKGFVYTPPSTGPTVPTGTTDILIDPPASVRIISMHTIAMAQMANASLKAGAREVTISHTWVVNQMQQPWFLNMCTANNLDNTDPKLLFRGPVVIGIVTDKLLLETVDVTHEDAFGQPMTWFVFCNASEQSLS